jgi:pilus assembly protein Flp/PilA
MHKLVLRFLREESAATAIEYGVIATGVALVVIAAVDNIGTHLKTTFTSVSSAL